MLVELKHEGYDIASTKFELDDNKSWALGYYTFDAYFDTPDRFAHIDSYSVDPETAELWEIMSCKTLTAPSVQRLQQEFRAKRHLPMRSKQKYAPCDTYLNSR